MIGRHIQPLIEDALRQFPVAAILGSRQVGKSTLAQELPSRAWPARYVTLDDFALLDAAAHDPDGFVDGLEPPVILDEVQRAPDVLRSIKRVVDRARKPGQFLLTGSANLLTLKSVSESLAGRVALFDLHPFSWSELARKKAPPDSVDRLFECKTAREFVASFAPKAATGHRAFTGRLLAGGYPVPALMKPGRARSQWFESYRRTYLQRDLREIANVARLHDFGRLLVATAANTGRLLNTAELSRDLGVPLNTVRRHLGLLETTFQAWTVRPYYANIRKRLVKTPKLYFSDTGLAAHLMAAEDWDTLQAQNRAGSMVETWVAAELRKLATLSRKRTDIHFWRTHSGREVDFLLARGTRLAAVEVKWARRIAGDDIGAIETCRADLKGRLGLSVVLYSGRTAFALNDHVAAVPLPAFFS
ncbi:MAG: ATP-binding protein [Planctomycetota bacterium]|jgi:predicted AAA+ superfamily ATPase